MPFVFVDILYYVMYKRS